MDNTKPGTTVPIKKRRNNRSAGHSYELTLMHEMRALGFPHVVTSRSESRSRDAEKIDLINKDEGKNGRLPYNIQAKNSCQLIKYNEILLRGRGKTVRPKAGGTKIIAVPPMPKVDGVVNVIIHKYTSNKGCVSGRFTTQGEFAIMEKSDFYKMVQELKEFRQLKAITLERRNQSPVTKNSKALYPMTLSDSTEKRKDDSAY